MTRSALTDKYVSQTLVAIRCKQSGAVNSFKQKIASGGVGMTANSSLVTCTKSRSSHRKLDHVKLNRAAMRLALTFLIFLGFYLCLSFEIMFFEVKSNTELLIFFSNNGNRIFFSTTFFTLFFLPQRRSRGGSFFFAEGSDAVGRGSRSAAPNCQSLEDLAKDSILNIDDLTSDNSAALLSDPMYPPVGSARYTVSLSYGWEASGEYFCGPDAPSHLACDCSILKVCDSASDPWGRQMGVCGCCATWVYGLIIAFVIFIVLVALTGFAILCFNGKSWFNGHPDPRIPLRPTRTLAIVAPAGSPLPQSAFLGFDSRDFSDLPSNNEGIVGSGSAETTISGSGTDADGLRNRRQVNLSRDFARPNERTMVFANRDSNTPTTGRDAHSLLTLEQRERPAVASLYDVYFRNLNRGTVMVSTQTATQRNEAEDESPYVYHYQNESQQQLTTSYAHTTSRGDERHLSHGTTANRVPPPPPPPHDRGTSGSRSRYPTSRPSLNSVATVNSPFDVDEARYNAARQRQELQESTPHDQTHVGLNALHTSSTTANNNQTCNANDDRSSYDYVYTNTNSNTNGSTAGSIHVSPFSPFAVARGNLREAGRVAPLIGYRNHRNPLEGNTIGRPNGNTRGIQQRGLLHVGAAATSAPYGGVVGGDAFPSRELSRPRNPIDAGEPISGLIDDGHEPFASRVARRR